MKTTPCLFALLALALSTIGCGSEKNAEARLVADQFLQLVMAEDFGGAYREAAMNLRTHTRFEIFNAEASALKAAPKAQVTWSEPEEKDGRLLLRGSVPRETGDPAQVTVALAREIDQWKVSQFEVE